MRRPPRRARDLRLFGAILLAILMVLTAPAMAAPPWPTLGRLARSALPGRARAQEPPPVIAQPDQDSAVRGIVQIVGTAVHPQFQRYELYYAPWPAPSDQAWVFIGDAHYQPQPLGLLGTWDSRSVPDGAYALRVRVVKQDGNYTDSDPRRVLVANTRQLDTPTPAATEAPVEVSTPVPSTASVAIEAPTITFETPTAAPSATAEPDVTPTPMLGGPTDPSAPPDLRSQLGSRLFAMARKAALYTGGFFVALGLFFGIKAVLYWIWQRIRP